MEDNKVACCDKGVDDCPSLRAGDPVMDIADSYSIKRPFASDREHD